MLLAAQSMAIGTVMVRWVSKYSDPDMATGWVMMLYPYSFCSMACLTEFSLQELN